MWRTLMVTLLTLAATPAAAQSSPYAGLEAREIKALAAEERLDLLAGRGMQQSLAAELNRFPGPAHAVDLADLLGLSDGQRARLAEIRAGMAGAAQTLGSEIVAAEARLDHVFAAGQADPAEVAALAEDLGQLRGRLRAVHLLAHIDARRALDDAQVERYVGLRGDATAVPDGTRRDRH